MQFKSRYMCLREALASSKKGRDSQDAFFCTPETQKATSAPGCVSFFVLLQHVKTMDLIAMRIASMIATLITLITLIIFTTLLNSIFGRDIMLFFHGI